MALVLSYSFLSHSSSYSFSYSNLENEEDSLSFYILNLHFICWQCGNFCKLEKWSITTMFLLFQRIISDPRSMFHKVMRTKSAFHFIHFFMGTFRQMFRNKTQVIDHFNSYDDKVKGNDCYIQGGLDFTRLKDYFEKYAKTHHDPKISVIFAVMTKDAIHMTAEFHVSSQTWLGFEDHFHMLIRAVNVSWTQFRIENQTSLFRMTRLDGECVTCQWRSTAESWIYAENEDDTNW